MSGDNKFCVDIKPAKNIKIPLPFGIEISSITNIAAGPATDCDIAHSLMLQLTPMLAGMTCMLRIFRVIQELEKAIKEGKLITSPGDLLDAIEKLTECFLFFNACEFSKMVSAILCMIVSYLNCFIEAFESVWNFQLGIDLNAAEGNPVLLANLTCAQNNAQASMEGMMNAIEAIKPLLDLINMLMEIVGLPALELPPLAAKTPTPGELLGGEDPMDPLKKLRDALLQANAVLPCKTECQ